jgi:twitching motility protein PilT
VTTCGGTGYKGRQGLYEVMAATGELRKLIMQGAGVDEIRAQALADGMLTLRMDGMRKVEQGITTLEEVIKETSGAMSTQTATPPQQETVVNLRALLEEMVQRGGSDLHLTTGQQPMIRVDGSITTGPSMTKVLDGKDTLNMAYSILTENQKKRFETEDELDFSFGIQNLSRFRGNVFKQRGAVTVVIRVIPYEIKSFEQLGLPPIVAKLAERPKGLVLVTGPTGSGKSTTLAAMIDKINREESGHILTVEDPIEFVHRHKRCIVNQREIGADTESFKAALKYALRQDPDVVLIGEMRDLETISAALTIAETGHLALATLHTNSAAETINRIIDVFPSNQQSQVRAQLAFVLEGVITQTLLPKAGGKGRVAALEIMVATPAIRATIRDDKIHQIYSIMQAGKKHGMQTMNDSLAQLVIAGDVKREDALRASTDPNELLRLMGERVPTA